MAESNTPTKTDGTSEKQESSPQSFFSAIWRVMLILLAAVLAITAGALAYDKFVKKI